VEDVAILRVGNVRVVVAWDLLENLARDCAGVGGGAAELRQHHRSATYQRVQNPHSVQIGESIEKRQRNTTQRNNQTLSSLLFSSLLLPLLFIKCLFPFDFLLLPSSLASAF